jgi:hypothetical protein
VEGVPLYISILGYCKNFSNDEKSKIYKMLLSYKIPNNDKEGGVVHIILHKHPRGWPGGHFIEYSNFLDILFFRSKSRRILNYRRTEDLCGHIE